jgi:putative inorganic carbon (HCO3(-)) transporter
MGAMLAFLWLKSRARIAMAFIGILAIGTTLLFMPPKYFTRMSTIENVNQDSSFQGRIDAWTVAWDVAKDRVLGAGFDGPRQDAIWNQYLPGVETRASHSIYFMVLGEHGFIGLAIYLALLAAAWRNLSRTIALSRDKPELLWAKDLASACQVGMIGFMVGGAALPMAYYDGFLTLLAMTVPLRAMIETRCAPAARPRWLHLRRPARATAAPGPTAPALAMKPQI